MADTRWNDGRAVPLAALFASAVVSVVLAAQAGLAFCRNRVVLALPSHLCGHVALGTSVPNASAGFPDSATALAICPVTLGVILIAVALSGCAVWALVRDRHNGVTIRLLTRRISTLPIASTAAYVAACATIPALLMPDAPADTAQTLLFLGTLVAAVLAASLVVTTLLVGAASVILACTGRAISVFLRDVRVQGQLPPHRARAPRRSFVPARARFAVVASGRGLPAPPCRFS